MRSKSFSRFFLLRSDVRVTTSLMPITVVSLRPRSLTHIACATNSMQLTWILGIFRADILVTGIKHIFIHQCCAWGHLSEERDLDWLANLNSLAFLDEDLSRVLAAVLTIKRRHTVLLWMMAFLEWLQSSHEVMSSRHTRSDNALRDASCNSSFDDGCNGIHGSDDLVLELRRHMELNLLEKVLRSTKTTNNEHVLRKS